MTVSSHATGAFRLIVMTPGCPIRPTVCENTARKAIHPRTHPTGGPKDISFSNLYSHVPGLPQVLL